MEMVFKALQGISKVIVNIYNGHIEVLIKRKGWVGCEKDIILGNFSHDVL